MKNSASSPSLKTVKPVMVFCYMCGREYGSRSFSIHIKTCQQKFHNEQQLKSDPQDRQTLPDCPALLDTILTGEYDSSTLKSYNDDAYQIYKYKVLPKCKYCERTFNYESLKVHEKGCSKKSKGSVTFDDYCENKELIRPKTLLCCVCGRQFGTKSLKIHYPQCLEKFNNDEFMRCPNPKDRRKAPQFTPEEIELFNVKEDWTHEEIEEFYKMAMARYRNESMMECYNCQRKFIPESLDKHMKNCILINGNLNPEGHLKKVQSQKVLHFYQKNIKKPKTLMCYICGRQFGLTSLTIHQKSCYEKFKLEQQNKPKNQRKKLPELPQQILEGDFNILVAETWEMEKIEKYNQLISDLYNKKTLTQCYICQRTFFQESLPKHLVHCQNNLEKLKFKRNKSCEENNIVKRCESIQKLKKQEKSVEKQIVKPRVLMCHICGRQFGTSSLQIHIKTCTEKFKIQQSLKDKDQQKQLPQLPQELKTEQYNIKTASQWSSEKIEHYNKIVSDIYNKKTLQTCYVCERTFFEESLVKHIKFCEKNALQKIKRSPSLNEKEMKILQRYKEIQNEKQTKQNQYYAMVENTKPKCLVCHICGRSYGLTSLQIHIPNCIKKFNDLENKKSPNDRKQLPSIENDLDLEEYDISAAQNWPREKIEAYNEICTRVYNHKSLTKCQYCSRTFFEEQIKKHETFCEKQAMKNMQKLKDTDENKKRPSLKKSQSMNCSLTCYDKKTQQPPQPKVLFCYICGREFGLYSLKIHSPQCKQKFLKQQSLKPEEKRKKLPELCLSSLQLSEKENAENFDFNIEKAESWTSEQIKKFNQVSREIYVNQSLYKCQYCGRSFVEQQLPKHVKFCEKEPFSRKMVKKVSQEQVSQQISDYQIPMTKPELKKQDLQEDDEMLFVQKRVKFDLQVMKDFNAKTVMSIIEEEDVEHHTSTVSPSPQSKNIMGNSRMSKKVNEFSIIPLEVSRLTQEQKPFTYHTPTINSPTIKNLMKPTASSQNKSLTMIIPKKAPVISKPKRCSSSNAMDLNVSLGSPKINLDKEQKQCEHCKKKVKLDLYQRHLQMCKSNVSMTGYMRKDVGKLKV